jgi:hypothetical protein
LWVTGFEIATAHPGGPSAFRRLRISLPGLNAGVTFAGNVHLLPSFRVTANASCANLHRKRAKIPKLDSVTASHRGNDFIQNGVNGPLYFGLVELWLLCRYTKN